MMTLSKSLHRFRWKALKVYGQNVGTTIPNHAQRKKTHIFVQV